MSAAARIRCTHAHTAYQPTSQEWKCPRCGSGTRNFWIEESPSPDCEDLHDSDEICCQACRFTATGKEFAAALVIAKGLVTCSHCQGKGVVPKEEP